MRTVSEIYNEIIVEKDNNLPTLQPSSDTTQNLLDDLSSNSKVAIWRLWAYLTSVAIWTHEKLFELFKKEIQTIADKANTGTVRWYQERGFDFQFGDALVYNNGSYKYVQIDSSKQIVKRVAIVERPDGSVFIKAAKLDAQGLPDALSSAELTALKAYYQNIKFAGTRLAVNSYPADELRVYYTIYYNPIHPLSDVKTAVEQAIEEHIITLEFNGTLYITKLTDAIQRALGVVDPIFDNAEARYGLLPYTAFSRSYQANAGYLKIDASNPLSSTITYIAE